MPRLYMFCGYPFAGKTTVAKILQQRFGFTRIDLDQMNTTLWQRGPVNAEEWEKTYAESYKQLGQALDAGHTVVYDATNFSRAQRDYLRSIADTYQAPSQVIYVALSESEARERWLRNRLTLERYDVRNEDFEYVVIHFEEPSLEEQVIRYHPSQPVDEWIHQTFFHKE